MKIRRKSPLTIIEIMIVIFIISIVGGVMSHNMKGSLVKGRAFKTETASREAYDILSLELASGTTLEEIVADPDKVLMGSGLVKSTKKLLKDGWGDDFKILIVGTEDFILYSEKWTAYLNGEKGMSFTEIEENYPWAYNLSVIDDPKKTS
jgi:type II secretory pathway pseudopilin PulG